LWRSRRRPGKVVWDTKVADYTQGYYSTLAPLVVKDKVMVGCSGGEMGIRGFLAAFDAKTGKEVWRTHTIPGPGEKGYETWQGDAYKHGKVTAVRDTNIRSRLILLLITRSSEPRKKFAHSSDR
jgi:outer membrane protein assembly factor BamB